VLGGPIDRLKLKVREERACDAICEEWSNARALVDSLRCVYLLIQQSFAHRAARVGNRRDGFGGFGGHDVRIWCVT
jgi:hypothetical protein